MEQYSEIAKARDSEGNEFKSIKEMWQKELNPTEQDKNEKIEGERIGGVKQWYDKQKTYWDGQAATVDGVLGGYGHLSKMELAYSVKIFQDFVGHLPGRKRAFDVGAGIGRVTKEILNHVFEEIDLLD